jgi:hypothetical protein
MTNEAERILAVKSKREADEAKERAVKAGEEAGRAREAEATVKKEVEETSERAKGRPRMMVRERRQLNRQVASSTGGE